MAEEWILKSELKKWLGKYWLPANESWSCEATAELNWLLDRNEKELPTHSFEPPGEIEVADVLTKSRYQTIRLFEKEDIEPTPRGIALRQARDICLYLESKSCYKPGKI